MQAATAFDFVLVFDEGQVPLKRGRVYTIGRSPACDVVMADRTVSREHARLDAREGLCIEDVGSASGVYVDDVRVVGRHPVAPGQRIRIGASVLTLLDVQVVRRENRETLADNPARTTQPNPVSGVRTPAVDVLMGLSKKLLARGRAQEAERLVTGSLCDVLEGWQNGWYSDPAVAEICAEHALDLAAATGSTRWLDYVFDLYASMDRVLPDELIDECYRAVHKLPVPSPRVVDAYLARIEGARGLGPGELFRVRRVRGLAQMIAER